MLMISRCNNVINSLLLVQVILTEPIHAVGETSGIAILREELIRRIDCWLRPEVSCPVGGGWSDWSEWGICEGLCGQIGLRERTRSCDRPLPLNGGMLCPGTKHEEIECQMPGCGESDYEEMLRGDYFRIKELELLKKVHSSYPSLRVRCLEGDCHLSIVQSILQENADRYWNALHCVKYNFGCPGGWSDWGKWSDCSARCGKGKQIKCRSCDNPIPTFPKLSCSGENCTFRPCQGDFCSLIKEGRWTPWTPWSRCSASCGQGFVKRMRECKTSESVVPRDQNTSADLCDKYIFKVFSKGRSTQLDIFTEELCFGEHLILKPCFIKPCPVDGGWSEWEPWSECSASCNLGVQFRSRACSSPPPRNEGQNCQGPVTHFKHCFLGPCTEMKHEIALFTGDGWLSYPGKGRSSRLLHIFIRFKPLGLNGILIERKPYIDNDSHVTLRLVGGYLVLVVSFGACETVLVNYEPVQLDKWMKVLVMVTPLLATMRINDSENSLRKHHSCRPKLPNFRAKTIVGFNFTGQIERVSVNFLQRTLSTREDIRSSNVYPSSNGNVEFELAGADEVFRSLDELLLVPCCPNIYLSVEIVVKSSSCDGLLMFMKDGSKERYLILSLEPRRVQLYYVHSGGFLECSDGIEPHQGHWTNIKIDYGSDDTWGLIVNGGKRHTIRKYKIDYSIHCSDSIMIGDIASTVLENLGENRIKGMNNESLDGVLGFLEVNYEVLDLSSLQAKVERGGETFSSEAVSSSFLYNEIHLEHNEPIELSCIYRNSSKYNGTTDYASINPTWLKFDKSLTVSDTPLQDGGIIYIISDNSVETVLKILNYSHQEAVEGFYSCWLPTNVFGSGNILITYGITISEYSTEQRSDIIGVPKISNAVNLLKHYFYTEENLFHKITYDVDHRQINTLKTAEFEYGFSILNTFSISMLILIAISALWLLTEYMQGKKSGWGLFSHRSVNKRLRYFELNDMSHNKHVKLLLGEENKFCRRKRIIKKRNISLRDH